MTPAHLSPVILVGESNPYGADPEMALYPLPYGASGDRLRTILGLDMLAYLELRRVNLCAGAFVMARARQAASAILSECRDLALCGRATPPPVIVTLGRKVATAFSVASPPMLSSTIVDGVTFICIPHPSGRNQQWRNPAAIAGARLMLHSHCPAVAWGKVAS